MLRTTNYRFKKKKNLITVKPIVFTDHNTCTDSVLQYELYKETLRTSLPGFVSQVGGQGGLFLGASITTFVQLAVSFVQFLSRRCRRTMQDSQVKVTSYRTLGVC